MIPNNPLIAPNLFNSLSTFLNRAFEGFEETGSCNSYQSSEHQLYAPDSGWILRLDAAGLDKEDIELKYEDQALLISSKARVSEDNEGSDSPLPAEFEFSKKFTLGNDVDVENIQAKLTDGVLEVSLPKTNTIKTINIQ